MSVANVLSIAGSDPSGGAGVQADLKTFAAFGVYGGAVITALTTQNTRGVTASHAISADIVAQQIDSVFADVRVDAVKIGMLANGDIASAVATALDRADVPTLVVDPVSRSTNGHALLDDAGLAVLRDRLIPRATVVTPNLNEAGALLNADAPTTMDEMRSAARALFALGCRYVYMKGGHLGGDTSPDLVYDGEQYIELPGARIVTRNTHGTGCTLSSAIAALLAQGACPIDAMRAAKHYVASAIARADQLSVGTGHGPLHHADPANRLGRLYLVATPRARMSDSEFLARIGAALDGGVDILQLRCKELEALPYIRLAERVRDLARAAGVPFIINDRPDIAIAVGADGVHLGQNDLPPSLAASLLPPNAIIGRSSHEPADADRVLDDGATYFAVGPVWETPTKPGRRAAGLSYVRDVAARGVAVPWYAIGGITHDNVTQVLSDGATRIAVVRAILDAIDPAVAAHGFVAALQRAEQPESLTCS